MIANSADPGKIMQIAASSLGLHFWLMSNLWDAGHLKENSTINSGKNSEQRRDLVH